MRAGERVLLYATAIQTGLRANELRSLTRGSLFLDAAQPLYMQGGVTTKNPQDARQYIKPDLAAELRQHIATTGPGGSGVCHASPVEVVAAMLRATWGSPAGVLKPGQAEPPSPMQRRGAMRLFLSTTSTTRRKPLRTSRHTCGAWLAQSGAHPKAVQAVMRHSVITLTMDTYGHLFPGQEADTVARLPNLLSDPQPEAVRATGTYDQAAQRPPGAQRMRSAQRAGTGKTWRSVASGSGATPTNRATKTLSPTSCQCPR